MPLQKRILVVDDEPDVTAYLKTFLEDEGYSVHTAVNGRDGFRECIAWKPDLISLDITMPEESGIRMYRDLRETEETASIPVVIVTGVSREFERFIGTRKQISAPDAYFEKPIDKAKFLSTLHNLLV